MHPFVEPCQRRLEPPEVEDGIEQVLEEAVQGKKACEHFNSDQCKKIAIHPDSRQGTQAEGAQQQCYYDRIAETVS